jgi:16S rRNA processing protein RimM
MAETAAAPYPDAVLLAVVLSAHGLKGEVKLKSFTEEPESLRRYGALTCGDGRTLEIASLRAVKADEALAVFKGIADRDAAESLKGQRLYVSRAALPKAEEDEFYHADLIGMRAEDESGKALGKVAAVHNFGAGDVIEISGDGAASRFVSFTKEAVPIVDVVARRVIVATIPETE